MDWDRMSKGQSGLIPYTSEHERGRGGGRERERERERERGELITLARILF